MNTLLKKLIAAILVITLAGANFSILGMYGISYALTTAELSEQKSTTQNLNVEFNSYFEDGGHIKTESMDSTTAKLLINVKVKNAGYLKNGVISFENVNFSINGEIDNQYIESVDTEKNKILLKQLNNGLDLTFEIPICILNDDKVSLDNFAKETKTIFTGIYVDGNGVENNISKEVVNKLLWNGTAQGKIESKLTKYIPYTTGEKYGVMVQTKIASKIVDSKLPIKETQISVQVPTINGINPTDVNVIALNTKATNGEENGTTFTSENYTYNSETGIVTIKVSNSENEIVWLKNVQDEYLVTFIFEGQDTYNYAKTNGINTESITSAKIEVYNDVETTLNIDSVTTIINKTNEFGAIMGDSYVEATDAISKGQIYSNFDSQTKFETEYNITYITTVDNKYLTDSIELRQSVDKFLTQDETVYSTTVSGKNYVYNKAVIVNKDVFNKILGKDGKIDVCKSDKTIIATIDKETTVKNGNYFLDISGANTNALYIKTSAPIEEGQLIINVEKAIKTNTDYSKSQFMSFKAIEIGSEGYINNSAGYNAVNYISLKEPKSVAEVSINKTELTTVVKNENVEIRTTLDTSSNYNALYKNPTLKIVLPSCISKVDVKNYDILMSNGLSIKGKPEVKTENNSQVIYIELEGIQEEYTIDAEYKGTIVVLNTDLTVDALTPSNTSNITMEFTNENEVSTNSKGTVETKVDIIAPTGVVTANGILNYAEGKNDIISISDESVIGEIAANSESRTATIYGKVVNNYSNNIKNIVILGRMPVEGNKKIDETESLGSTFSTTLYSTIVLSNIDTTKYTVYYSENVNATAELSNTNNGWSTTATNISKSYMIVINDYEMEAGESIEFSYNVQIPKSVNHNNYVYEMYKIYYENVSSIGTIEESKASSIVGLTTGQGPEITVELKSTVDTVREGQIVKMKVVVNNTGSVSAENVEAKIELPKNTKFMEYVSASGFSELDIITKTIEFGTVKAGEIVEKDYYIKIDDGIKIEDPVLGEEVEDYTEEELEEYIQNLIALQRVVTNKVIVTSDNLTGAIYSNDCEFIVEEGNISLEMFCKTNESQVLKTGDVLEYMINVTNISTSGDLSNVVVTVPLANGTIYKSAILKDGWDDKNGVTEGIYYDEKTNTVQIKIDTLDKIKLIVLEVEVLEFEGTIEAMAKAQADGMEEHYSNVLEFVSEIVALELSELSSSPKYIKEGENVTYTLKVKNTGNSIVRNIHLSDTLPEELIFVEATYTYMGEKYSVTNLKNGELKIIINQLQPGEITTIKVIATAKLLSDKNDKEIENYMTVKANSYDEVTTNTVKNIIEYYEKAHEEVEDKVPTETRYKVTGTAWIDENKNGRHDSNEGILPDVKVVLLNKKDNSIVRDIDTNEQKVSITNSEGKYEFSNLKKGEYLVIFLYDASRYSITTYQENNVDESLNSDVISINITLNGTRTVAGTSDVIKIIEDNARDIDIGLYNSQKFDLRLDKYVTKITLTTPTSGTNTYEYGNSKLEKIEVLSKNLGSSNIVIEYKIVITNEGAVPGYAKKIVDYLPEGVGFNTELNKDWYLSDNGNVYNASLANEVINPGESKEVTIIVTKKITESSLGTLNNNAEIFETYNELGLKDIDSTANNIVQNEDDMSEANIVLSIVTGKTVMYTTITLGVVAILGFGIWEIKKRVLNKKSI